jgi:hypothetical protein
VRGVRCRTPRVFTRALQRGCLGESRREAYDNEVTIRSRLGCGVALSALFVAFACSEEDTGDSVGGGPPVQPGTGGMFLGPLPSDTGGNGHGGSSSAQGGRGSRACAGVPIDDAASAGAGADPNVCESLSREAESLPVDLYIMMDRSISMNEPAGDTGQTRWEAIRDAVEAFVTSPDAGEIGAGLGFFGKSLGGDDDIDCDPENYAEPVVAIGPLASTGEDLLAAIDDTIPGGFTPTLPALEGAISHARDWAEDHPERAVMVLLVTDGYPTQCSGAIDDVAAAAREAYAADPSVRTFVIGLDGTQNLEGIARAGGTESAFVVESADIAQSFVEVLLNITSAQLSCSFELPPSPDPDLEIDRERVQIVYTPETSGEPEEVPFIESAEACARQPNGGWYYSGSQITVCPCTCARFGAGRVDVRLGCQPVIGLR